MRGILGIAVAVVATVSLVVVLFTFNQANQEQLSLTSDIQYRTRVLADSLQDSIEPSLISHATSTTQKILDRIAQNERTAGLAVYNADGTIIAKSKNLQENSLLAQNILSAMDKDQATGFFGRSELGSIYTYVVPLHEENRVIGALTLAQNTTYIDETITRIWRESLVHLLTQLALFGIAIYVLVRWVFLKPLQNIAESIRKTRLGESFDVNHSSIFGSLTREIAKMSSSLLQARAIASEEARMRLEQIDSPWTAERLKEFIKLTLRGRPIFVVSNREPYVHEYVRNELRWHVPAGGAVTALESVMEACEGTWIAYGSGGADKETTDQDGKIRVPPEEPKYTLKRIWLEKEDVDGYYNGFSNEALWPLCHMAHVRPIFRKEDWTSYRKVNGEFAKSVLAEIRGIERPLVLVQDYHLALLPQLIKASRPDAQVALFWHIPWPSAEAFSICPWRKEILQGMLGADLIGFHTQQYCNSFLNTVGSELESLIDFERFSISYSGHMSYVKPFPISIAYPGLAEPKNNVSREILQRLNINSEYLLLGVDRLDYTKGILERLKGVEYFFDSHPKFVEKATFLQIASPTRESVEKYKQYASDVTAEAERINKRLGTRTWQPIVLEKSTYTHSQLRNLYELANVCMVTSLHDGMNLVAKEYAASRTHEDGALVLSKFTGASRDMRGALLVNPYSAEEMGEILYTAITMPKSEQHRRMKSMRDSVQDYNVYRWAAELLKALASIA